MTSKFSIDNRDLLQRISSGEAVVGIDFGNLIVRELAAFRLAAMDSEPLAVTDDELNAALQLHRLKVDGHSQLSDAFRAGFRYARRTTPQPAPVAPVCTCPSGDGSLRWPCPVHPGNSPAIPDAARDALEKALTAMEFMGDTLNNLDAVCTEDVELVAPAFDAVRSVLAAAQQEVKGE